MKHIWSVLCQKSVVDASSNNVSLIDVFERLEVDMVPIKAADQRKITEFVLPMRYELVSLWVKTKKANQEEQSDVKIVVKSPGGAEINKFEKKLTIPKDKQRVRDINKIQGIRLNKDGIYVFKVMVRPGGNATFETVAEIPLEIYLNS